MFKTIISILLLLFISCKGKKSGEESLSGNPISGLTLFLVGDVKTSKNPIKLGDTIPSSEDILVGKKSTADIQILNIEEDIVIRLKEDSKFQLDEKILSKERKKNLYVRTGEALVHVKKLKQNESLNVITPTIAVGVRGTQFSVSIDPKTGTNKLSLYEGSVSVTPSLLEFNELGEDALESAGIQTQVDEWKKKSEVIIEPGQQLEANPKTSKEFLTKIGWDEIKSKPEVKDFLNKKANSTLTEEDKSKVKATLKSYYEDPKNKERVNKALNEVKISYSTTSIPSPELNSKLEELKELVAIEKEKLLNTTDKSIPIAERNKQIRENLMKRIAEITGDDVRTIKLTNGKTLRGVYSIVEKGSERTIIITTPEEIFTIPQDQFDDFAD